VLGERALVTNLSVKVCNCAVLLTWDGVPNVTYSVVRTDPGTSSSRCIASGLVRPQWLDTIATGLAPGMAVAYGVTVDESADPPATADAVFGTPKRTFLPTVQAAVAAVRQAVAFVAVPSINAGLAAEMVLPSSSRPVQFGDSSVVTGDLQAVSEPTLCVRFESLSMVPVGSGIYDLSIDTAIVVRLPNAGDSTPEDYELVGLSVIDAITHTLSGKLFAFVASADLATGKPMLPGTAVLQDAHVISARRDTGDTVSLGGAARLVSWTLIHRCSISQG